MIKILSGVFIVNLKHIQPTHLAFVLSQPAFACSKLTMETLEQCLNSVRSYAPFTKVLQPIPKILNICYNFHNKDII